jgi:SAM-dependent methyltransferase
MTNTFNVNDYWLKRGETYFHEERLALEYHRVQERFLFDILRESRVPPRRILELGCGFGRITRLLAEQFPQARITALDLSPDQLANAKTYCTGLNNVSFEQYDFYSGQPFPGSDYDLVIAIEVFLHHPAHIVRGLLGRLSSISQLIVNIDWSEDWRWKTPEHVWIHDYPALYREAGLACAAFPLPQRVEGKLQKLFIAGAQLAPGLFALEQKVAHASQAAETANATAFADLSSPERWLQSLQLAQEDILKIIPSGSSFILVNEDQWGPEQTFPGRRTYPFLEKNGQYWGPPPEDVTAIAELQRLRVSGAGFIVFAWPSFWWFKHYSGFCQHLHDSFPCLLDNERVVIFSLNPSYAKQ